MKIKNFTFWVLISLFLHSSLGLAGGSNKKTLGFKEKPKSIVRTSKLIGMIYLASLVNEVSAQVKVLQGKLDPNRELVQNPGRQLQSIETVCSKIGDLSSQVTSVCDYSISYPQSASTKYCPNKSFSFDFCKTRNYLGICVPGTRAEWVDIPCGININFASQSICDSNSADDFVDRGEGVCLCLDTLVDIDLDDLSDLGGLSTAQLSNLIKSTSCALNSAFNVQNNRGDVTQALYADPDYVIALPEIDTTMYIQVLAHLGKCYFSGECFGVASVLIDFAKETAIVMTREVVDVMVDYFSDVRNPINAFNILRFQINENLKILNNLPDCAAADLKEDYDKLRNHLETIAGLVKELENLDVQGVFDDIKELSDFFENVETDSLSLVLESLPSEKIESIVETISKFDVVIRLRDSIVKVKNLAFPLVESMSTINNAADFAEYLLSKDECLDDAFPYTRQDLKGSFARVSSAIKSFQSLNGSFDFKVGVATYMQWADLSLNMPCVTTDETCWTGSGYRQCASYPRFYSCLQKEHVPFPNHHIPYVRIDVQRSPVLAGNDYGPPVASPDYGFNYDYSYGLANDGSVAIPPVDYNDSASSAPAPEAVAGSYDPSGTDTYFATDYDNPYASPYQAYEVYAEDEQHLEVALPEAAERPSIYYFNDYDGGQAPAE